MMQLRPSCPEDQVAIMALINAVYHEYGDCLCLENADRDLLDIDTYYRRSAYSGVSIWKRPCVAVLGVHSLCTGPLLGHTPTACIALSFGLILVLRGPMCSLRALASNARVASGLWTTAAYRIKSIFSSSTCRQGG
jgi:hypothetical protein